MQQVHVGKAVKNDAWITKNEQEDPDILPELPGYHVLVRPVSIKQETKGGILLPDSTREDMAYLTTVGKVVAIGDLAYADEEKFNKGPWCKIDDYVCYGSWGQLNQMFCLNYNNKFYIFTIIEIPNNDSIESKYTINYLFVLDDDYLYNLNIT